MLHAQPAASGSLYGQVSNAATLANLGGVRVSVTGTNFQALTERDGTYELHGLPAGSHLVVFEYPGLDRQELSVTVGPGLRIRQDVALSSNVYVMEAYTVASEREGNAAAIAAQRNSVNLQNIITADAFGNIAKGNVGDFLKRIPGIAGTTDEVDTENIVLRGMAANFTSLDIDGTRVSSGGTSRAQSAGAIPTDMIETIEVIKSPTPDTDADSLGGRINLVTKSAYDRQGRRITLRAASSYSFTYGSDVGRGRDSALAPSLAASFSDVFSVFGGERNLGVHVGANWLRILDVRGTTSWGDNYTTVNGVQYPRFNNASIALHGNDRGGVNARLDYRHSRQLSLGASASFNTYTDRMYRTRNQLRNGTARPALSDDHSFVVIDGANYGTERSNRDRKTDRVAASLRMDYRNSSGLRLQGDVTFDESDQRVFNQFFTTTSNRKIDYVLDRVDGDPRWPALRIISAPYTGTTRVTTALPDTYLDINPFDDDFREVSSASGLQWQRNYSLNRVVGTKWDLTKNFRGRTPFEVKTGFRYRGQIQSSNRDDLRGQISMTGYGRDLRDLIDHTWDLGGAIGRYEPGVVIDLDKVTQAMGISFAGRAEDPINSWNYNPAVFQIDTSGTRQNTLQDYRRIEEDVYATYLQSTITLGKLRTIGGVRVEHTENERNQPKRDRSRAGTIAEWTSRTTNSAKYTNYFPSLHTRYEIRKNLILHASFGTTSGRPNWGQLMGVSDVNETNYTISVPNLDLEPRRSKNYDLSLEYYFEPVGVISVGVFQKNIKNYDVSAVWDITPEEAADLGAQPAPGDDTPWRVTSRINAGDGQVRGIELNYSQQLSFLPGAARGLGIFSNFTYLETEGTFDRTGTGSQPPEKTNRLQGFIPRTANAGLSYIYHKYDLRLSWNYTDDWPENTPTDPATAKIRGSRWTMDFTGKYRLSQRLTLFADLVNLTSNHGKKYRGYGEPHLRNETNALGFLLTGGITATF